MPRHSSSGGGIAKAKVGGKLVKKLQRKNKKGLTVCVKKAAKPARVKKAAKICHSPKLEDWSRVMIQEMNDILSKAKESYMNKVPTYGGYSVFSGYGGDDVESLAFAFSNLNPTL